MSPAARRRSRAIRIVSRPCRKYDERPAGQVPELIVIHFSATRTMEEIFDIFHRGPLPVSSHYAIDDDGTIYALVPESKRAWHAGLSSHAGRPDVNSRSVGIELRNAGCLTPAGDGARFRTVLGRLFSPRNEVRPSGGRWWESYAEPQLAALTALCREIAGRYGIPPHRFVGHSDVALPAGRKIDPGPLFDWVRLRRETGPSAGA